MSADYMREPFQHQGGDAWEAPQMPVVYHLDVADRLCYVNRCWDWFAENNDGNHLHAEYVLGTSLWDLMTEVDVCAWYGALFAHARAGNPVVLTIRCDSADRRRLLRIHLFSGGEGLVSCVCGVMAAMRRPSVRLLDRTLPPGDDTVRLCSWCGRSEVRLGNWLEVEDAVAQLGLTPTGPLPQIGYTTCPECARYVAALAAAPPSDTAAQAVVAIVAQLWASPLSLLIPLRRYTSASDCNRAKPKRAQTTQASDGTICVISIAIARLPPRRTGLGSDEMNGAASRWSAAASASAKRSSPKPA
jgi:hypothetical protein